MASQTHTSEKVTLPWIDEPVDLSEAVELVAQASDDDDNAIQNVSERVEQLERRVETLEDGTTPPCPSCENGGTVYKAGVGAAKLASNGSLDDANADALNRESHVCLDCRKSFTPSFD